MNHTNAKMINSFCFKLVIFPRFETMTIIYLFFVSPSHSCVLVFQTYKHRGVKNYPLDVLS